jgi:hypothetical protein
MKKALMNPKDYFFRKLKSIKKKRNFQLQFEKFQVLSKNNRFDLKKQDLWPFLDDATTETSFDSHYVYHPAWAARILKQINPGKHVDISSALAFCSMISAFIPVEFYDYRPANLSLSNLKSGHADLCNLFFETESIESLSCMHTIEHIGLGRYGDPLDPDGDIKAINELKRVVKTNGHLLFVTPVGKPKLQFNGQRIYSFEMVMDYFSGFSLKDYSLVIDNGEFISPADPKLSDMQNCGCGCFWFQKNY